MIRKNFNRDWEWKKEGEERFQAVELPHDAMLSEQRTEDAPSTNAGAFFQGGKYVYRKKFYVPKEWQGDYAALEFEGVYQNSEVYLNGERIGGCAYGYVPFLAEMSEKLNYGGENEVIVTVDNSRHPNSRWYSGSGIYRPVHMVHGKKERILSHGVRITTLSYEPARIRVETEATGGTPKVIILEPETGKIIAAGKGTSVELAIPHARLWSAEEPNLYQCRVELHSSEAIVDSEEEIFGIRKLEWNKNGFFVNGVNTLLKGGCIHHDNGVLGACCYEEAEERRVSIMKEHGYNAIRSAHNPTSEAVLRACDHYGMYVMDETWDMWYFHKNKYDYALEFPEHYRQDIEAMVLRDFNHPSVIMYSIANEVSEPKDEKGIKLTEEMVNYIHELDNSRPVTGGINLMVMHMASKGKGIYKEEGGRSDQDKKEGKKKKKNASGSLFFNMITSIIGTRMNGMANSEEADRVTTPCLDTLDIAGYNYASGRYEKEGTLHPNRVIIGTETFPMDIARNWAMVKKYPYLIGDFMWTAWDYLGEAGLGAWNYSPDGAAFDKPYPWLLADTGAIDILGNAGAECYYAETVWGYRKTPYIGVRPVNHPGVRVKKATWRGTNALDSWSWNNCEGNMAEVEVYADAAFVELFLDGKKLGRKKINDYKVMFKVKYHPGILTAVSYDGTGKEISRSELCSARGKTEVRILPEKETAQKGEILFVPICITDREGIVESNCDKKLTVHVQGGRLLGFGSANPRTEESFLSGIYTTYYGKSLAVVRAEENTGSVTITVQASGMADAEKVIRIK
ncbi:glycoside hydrolase family 2 TIM barrel-domain containing protein [Agathobacter sp.]|uniref:glycoside hydrolase family 2 TIM barrel-domain containing protein n=1 Tax=Agathobacter sp. TaxID=2021311 RepID=UPI003FD824DB